MKRYTESNFSISLVQTICKMNIYFYSDFQIISIDRFESNLENGNKKKAREGAGTPPLAAPVRPSAQITTVRSSV